MDRRSFICDIVIITLAAPAIAQPGRTLPVIGILHSVHNPRGRTMTALREGLQDLGYVDGQSVTLVYRSGERGIETLPALAEELVQRHVDVLYAVGPAAVRAATQATATIPIIAIDLESDPVGKGWVRSFAQPGGNVTGLFLDLPGLAGKWLQLLRDADPQAELVGIMWDSATGSSQLDAVRVAAQNLGTRLQLLAIQTPKDFDEAIRTGLRDGIKAIVILSSPIFDTNSPRIAALTVKNRLPAISAFREFADAGGVMAYGPNLKEYFRRSASYFAKIIDGAKPSDLPVELPTKFQLVINLKTAKALGLTIPQSLLLRADDVIQ
jgi:putative tryptophan/tyrosine transport system substrate-binding protein